MIGFHLLLMSQTWFNVVYEIQNTDLVKHSDIYVVCCEVWMTADHRDELTPGQDNDDGSNVTFRFNMARVISIEE